MELPKPKCSDQNFSNGLDVEFEEPAPQLSSRKRGVNLTFGRAKAPVTRRRYDVRLDKGIPWANAKAY